MPSARPVKAAKTKAVTNPVVDKVEEDFDEASSSSSDAAESSPREDDQIGGSDSDSLDSDGPRKRRRTSPAAHQDSQPVKSAFNVPSRIKQAVKVKPAIPSEPVSRVLAPTNAKTTFESLGVRPWLVQALANMAIKRPTGIQKASIPQIISGRDCIGGSRTGSGKTVAFAVPILQKWAENPSAIFGLVLTPTRLVTPIYP
jgi:ATP-dependent RNA helicase DDX49/DBP8